MSERRAACACIGMRQCGAAGAIAPGTVFGNDGARWMHRASIGGSAVGWAVAHEERVDAPAIHAS
jgi:hypothetical protein